MNTRNHIKMQKLVMFVRKNLKINILSIKNIIKLGSIGVIQVIIENLRTVYVI